VRRRRDATAPSGVRRAISRSVHRVCCRSYTLLRFIKAEYLDKMNEQSEKDAHAEINSYYFNISLIGDVILSIVRQDALLAIFSFVFVFLWLRINTNSWFLAFVGFFGGCGRLARAPSSGVS
jgi:hypothetical protein